MNKHAALLDLDGTLIDSLNIYYVAVNHILTMFDVSCTYEEMFERSGASGVELYTHFLKLHNKYDESMKEQLVEMYYRKAEEMLPGVEFPKESARTICALKDRGYKVAICTGASRMFVDSILPRSLLNVVDSIVTCDDVVAGKPDPETFLSAADYVGVEPSNCTVVGDSMNDLIGANSAGMRFILVRNKYNTYIKDGYIREINSIEELLT